VKDVVGEADGRHPARAELALDAIAIGQSRFQAIDHRVVLRFITSDLRGE
jgi:hypothetical protein